MPSCPCVNFRSAFFVCLLVGWNKPRKSLLRLPPWARSKIPDWEYIHSGRVALPAVLPKIHRRPEPLYVPTQVNTLKVDGLARIPELTRALYKSHPEPPNSGPRSPASDPPSHEHSRQSRVVSTNTQGNQGAFTGLVRDTPIIPLASLCLFKSENILLFTLNCLETTSKILTLLFNTQ